MELASQLSPADLAVLRTLLTHSGQVLGRTTIQRFAGLDHCSARRCDSVLVSLRRVLGADAIITVRQRGWMLSDSGVLAAEEVLGRPAIAS